MSNGWSCNANTAQGRVTQIANVAALLFPGHASKVLARRFDDLNGRTPLEHVKRNSSAWEDMIEAMRVMSDAKSKGLEL